VQALYHQYLHRAADPAGLETFTNGLQLGASGEQILALILASDEYFILA